MNIRIANQKLEESVIESIVDGPGFRLTLFLQGCKHYCHNCHNKSTWDFNGGYLISTQELADHIVQRLLRSSYFSGLTISGGDPLYQSKELEELIVLIKEKIPNIDIWVYTGFIYEEIKNLSVLKLINVLVDGPFIEAKKDLTQKFKGSTNQRIIYLKKGVPEI